MAWTTEKERDRSCAGDTALMLVRTVEICSGRHRSTEQELNLLPDHSKLEQLTRSICCRLATEAPGLLVRVCTHRSKIIYICVHPLCTI
jgi:hypothetical protein